MSNPSSRSAANNVAGTTGAAGTKPASSEETVPRKSSLADAVLTNFIAVDPKSIALLNQLKKIALANSTVLISGESGVGKDLCAAAVHYMGPHPNEPLLKIDCASLPHELMESELFGYERGAFTGASQMKRGRLELAGSGTIVFDEVAALSLAMQAKLLRVIEERKFDRLGATQSVALSAEARIVAITNINLERAVAERSFREDLFYRLNVIPITIPPLRERRGDIRALAHHFLKQFEPAQHGEKKNFLEPALTALERHSFPGNVRELRNIVERSAMIASSEIHPEDLPPDVIGSQSGQPVRKQTLEELERSYIAEVLDFCRGKKSKAAEILGINRKTLLEKRKRYGLDK